MFKTILAHATLIRLGLLINFYFWYLRQSVIHTFLYLSLCACSLPSSASMLRLLLLHVVTVQVGFGGRSRGRSRRRRAGGRAAQTARLGVGSPAREPVLTPPRG